jgi:hypothetical protein
LLTAREDRRRHGESGDAVTAGSFFRRPRGMIPASEDPCFRSQSVAVGLVAEQRGKRGELAAAGAPLDLEPMSPSTKPAPPTP